MNKEKKHFLKHIKDVEDFARGKRGLVSLGVLDHKKVLLKKHNPDASVDTIHHEANMLIFLNKHNIGPQFLFFEDNILVREFVEGEEFLEYLRRVDKKEILRVLSIVFDQCRTLDLLGVNKLELTRPYKHILITTKDSLFRKKGSVVQIDFERSRYVEHPKNVTQFIQCICREKVRLILEEKNIIIDTKKLFSLSKQYKNSLQENIFEKIINTFNGFILEKQFSYKVYRIITNIPSGSVTSYKEIARVLDSSPRAIGQALKNNPFSPQVPCHRVIKSDGSLGGFFGSEENQELMRKKSLLEQEGILFDDQGRINKEQIIKL